MKLLMITTRGDSIGGAQIHIKDMLVQLKADGHDVSVAFGREGHFSFMLQEYGVSYRLIDNLVRSIELWKDIKALLEIITLIREIKPDLVALHSSKAGLLGRIAAKFVGVPVIFTAHGWSFTEGVASKKRKFYQYIEKIAAYSTDRIITVSQYDKKLALSLGVASENKMIAIHNGMKDIKNELRASHSNAIPKIIMVARFQEQKNHKILIEVLHDLQDKKWTLELVGEDGGLMPEIKDLIQELKLEDRVIFLGKRDDVDMLLAQSDIFVLTSYWEGFPLTIIEAMRAGLPVIASDVGGVSEAIIEGETGFLVSEKEDLLNSLTALLESVKKRKLLGEKGRKQYEDHFTFEEMYRKTCDVYEKAILSKQ